MALITNNTSPIDAEDWREMMDTEFLKRMKYSPMGSKLPNHNHGMAYGNSVSDHTHTYSDAQVAIRPNRWSEKNLLSMLASRFCWGVESKCPFQRVLPYKAPEKVIVFVIAHDEPVVFEDDPHLYPSDTLVTQLRLLAEAL